jgi:hypothetical protein
VALAVGNDALQIFARSVADFIADKRRPREVAALGGFSVALRAVVLEYWIRDQAIVG